ncbi:MAG: hypothetical protein FWG80_04865 [Alphaproteobacteria bacterium]|nr:hypothetical protein [Alphaproteobacteria bacterium]
MKYILFKLIFIILPLICLNNHALADDDCETILHSTLHGLGVKSEDDLNRKNNNGASYIDIVQTVFCNEQRCAKYNGVYKNERFFIVYGNDLLPISLDLSCEESAVDYKAEVEKLAELKDGRNRQIFTLFNEFYIWLGVDTIVTEPIIIDQGKATEKILVPHIVPMRKPASSYYCALAPYDPGSRGLSGVIHRLRQSLIHIAGEQVKSLAADEYYTIGVSSLKGPYFFEFGKNLLSYAHKGEPISFRTQQDASTFVNSLISNYYKMEDSQTCRLNYGIIQKICEMEESGNKYECTKNMKLVLTYVVAPR